MAYLITNNAFTSDSYAVRITRLNYLRTSIDTYAAELIITGDLLTWAQGAFDNFNNLLAEQSVQIGEKDEAFQTSQELYAELRERYQVLKEILISRYANNDDLLQVYGISGETTENDKMLHIAANKLIQGHNNQKLAGDTLVLPDLMIANFQTLINDTWVADGNTSVQSTQAGDATKSLRSAFDTDTKRFQQLYNWAKATWRKDDPKLLSLGFDLVYSKIGGSPPASPTNLSFDEVSHIFSWDAIPDATSYQLAYCQDGQPVQEWMSDYNGIENSTLFEPGDGNWLVKIRARNSNGYSDWSSTLPVIYVSGLPMPDYLSMSVTNPTTKTIGLNWGAVAGATVYKLYHSAVAIDAPAGAYVLFGEYAGTSYSGVFSSPNRHYFYIIAANDTEASLPTPESYVDME